MNVKISLTLRGKYRFRAFAARVPKRIFGPNRQEALHGVKISTMRWVDHLASMGQTIRAHKILVGEPELVRQTYIS
jgi:hypothetical protein